MPDTKPGISFIDSVCNACQFTEYEKTVDWEKRWNRLLEIAVATLGVTFEGSETPGAFRVNVKSEYNAVIPVSGGKDSTFVAVTARERLGLNPLCVNVAPCEPTPRGERNVKNLSKLGFDVIRFMPNQKIMPTLVKRSFCEDGDPCTSHEFLLYSVPVRVAMARKIPLIIWGENIQLMYGNPGGFTDASEQKNIGGLWGRDATHWLCDGVSESDLISFQHPTAQEIKEAGVKAIYLGDYVLWDSRKVGKFAVEHGLEVRPDEEDLGIGSPFIERKHTPELLGTGGYWNFEQLDDEFPVIGHYLKFQKFGYGRATDQACRDIRAGHITREEGFELAQKYDGQLNPLYIERFCKYIGITEEEFHKVCKGYYRNPVKF